MHVRALRSVYVYSYLYTYVCVIDILIGIWHAYAYACMRLGVHLYMRYRKRSDVLWKGEFDSPCPSVRAWSPGSH